MSPSISSYNQSHLVYLVVTSSRNMTNIWYDRSTINIDEPSVLELTSTHTNPSCYGESDGNIDLSVSGGTIPYNYLWSNTQSNQDISNLSAGTYDITVTDSNSCTTTKNINLIAPAEITTTYSTTKKSCNVSNGTASIIASNGNGN